VYLPDGPGPFPVVAVRTPYHRTNHVGHASEFTERGYGFVAQDCRGRYDSDGVFVPLVHEAADGQATIDWIANQDWCNGRVGLWGRSYPGIVQAPAAAGRHEALRCFAPSVAPGSFFHDWIRYDGAYALANTVRWGLGRTTCRTAPSEAHFRWPDLYRLSSLDAIAAASGVHAPTVRAWAEHDREDEYWQAVDQRRLYPAVAVPGLHIGGWFDHISRGRIEAYCGITARGASDAGRDGQRLVLGPWGHQTLGQSAFGDWDFGPDAALNPLALEMQFFDFHLKDEDNGFSAAPRVRAFLMGENRWLTFDDWPPPDASDQRWHLDSGGSANLIGGDGRLDLSEPTGDRSDRYVYDPKNPVPTCGGPIYWGLVQLGPLGPVDQRPILDRPDVLCYRSAPLPEPVAVVGEASVDLVLSADVEDTDVIVKLCVQEPAGPIRCLTVGSLRCRYRDSMSSPRPLAPSEPTPVRVRLLPTAYVFAPGSRLVLLITSSDFPRIEAHPNVIATPLSGATPRPARVEIHHGPAAHSSLLLPTVPTW
jgi:putative CocE/NonD family hydrolase